MLRVALIGLGGGAERIHLPALQSVSNLELVASCDTDRARAAAVGHRFRVGRIYHDARLMLETEHPDLVIVGTPPQSHCELSLLALSHGAHVFCEKPFVLTPEDADRVIAAADAQARAVVVNNQYRFMKMYAATREHTARGEFGRPFLLQGWQQMFHPPSKEQNWRAEMVQSTLVEFGTHAFDLMCFLFDSFPLSITAQMPRPLPDIAADVIVAVMLRFPDEAVATLVLNRVSHAPERYFEMRLDCTRASIRMSLGGVARASLDWSKPLGRPITRWSLVKGGEARVEAGGRSRVLAQEPNKAFASATAKNLRQFAASIERGEMDRAPLHHARDLIRLVCAGYESARTGETVWLSRGS